MNLHKNLSLVFILIASLYFSCKNEPKKNSDAEKVSADSTTMTSTYPSEQEKSANIPSATTSAASSTTDSVNVSVKTFQENSEWGYDILIGDKLYIHQPHVPSVNGVHYFKTEGDARKAADFVAYKIKHHIMPPSVTPAELDSLGVTQK